MDLVADLPPLLNTKKMAGKAWTLREKTVLRALYDNASIEALQIALPDRSQCAINIMANKMGLRRSDDYLRKQMERCHAGGKSKATQFKKGMKPWNDGMKGLDIGGKETRFKKGHTPHNTNELGTVKIRKVKGIKYYYIKTEAGMVELHRKVWEDLNGPIPPGHVVRMKDGNSLNVAPDNLEMIDQATHMIRNSVQRYPEWLKDLIRTKAVLTRKINMHGKR